MNLHASPYNNGLLFVNFNQDFGKYVDYDIKCRKKNFVFDFFDLFFLLSIFMLIMLFIHTCIF